MAKVQRTAKNRVQAREAREAVEEKKAQLERDKQLSEQQKQAVLAKEYKACKAADRDEPHYGRPGRYRL